MCLTTLLSLYSGRGEEYLFENDFCTFSVEMKCFAYDPNKSNGLLFLKFSVTTSFSFLKAILNLRKYSFS